MTSQANSILMTQKSPAQISALVHMRSNALNTRRLAVEPQEPRRIRDFRQMVARLRGEVSLLLALPGGPEHSRHTVAEFWRNVAGLREFFGINSGISQIVSMLRTARFCWLDRDTSRDMLRVMSECLQAIAIHAAYTDEFADEIGDRLEEAGVDLNAVGSLKTASGS